jgi:hypothetical protein
MLVRAGQRAITIDDSPACLARLQVLEARALAALEGYDTDASVDALFIAIAGCGCCAVVGAGDGPALAPAGVVFVRVIVGARNCTGVNAQLPHGRPKSFRRNRRVINKIVVMHIYEKLSRYVDWIGNQDIYNYG